MSDDSGGQTTPAKGAKTRHQHGAERTGWPAPDQAKGGPPPRSGKTMHHPAFRIGEVKHGK
jgi:hypothetical protein